ncbi:MAG: phosphotransferase [Streptosporangiales bacterium]|nr:phosphotransferase [Streptosporangiales bacterium]
MTVDVGPPGVDVPRLREWLARTLPDAGELQGVQHISGGKSNLTYRVELSEGPVVLRRPPLGHVLPTAHDMGREYRVLAALHHTSVPVPRPLTHCTDESVIGAPFYLMEWVDGTVIRNAEDAAVLDEARARRISERLAEVFAEIHGVDFAQVGLAEHGRPNGYLERQLRRWSQQWERSETRPLPALHRLVERLAERMPARQDAALLHGDYRIDNALVRLDPVPDILAVVDWEMSTLGDPLADLGLTLTYWADAGDEERAAVPVAVGVTSRPGFLGSAEFAGRYAELSGRDLTGLDFYIAFGHFKLAVVMEGIHARYLQGKTVGEGFESEGEAVPLLIDRAHRILDKGGM